MQFGKQKSKFPRTFITKIIINLKRYKNRLSKEEVH